LQLGAKKNTEQTNLLPHVAEQTHLLEHKNPHATNQIKKSTDFYRFL
jgi:hypothetical protein